MKKIFSVLLLCLCFSAFSEVVTCPHCNKSFDTNNVKKTNTVSKTFNKADYEEWNSSKLTLLGNKNLNKKIVLKNVYIDGIEKYGVIVYEGKMPQGSIWYCSFEDNLIDKIMKAQEESRQQLRSGFKNLYGYVELNVQKNPVIHITHIETAY